MDARTPVIHWSAAYDSGNGNVDRQHRYIFDLANIVIEEAQTGGGNAALRPAFDALREYLVNHFTDEEEFLTGIGCDTVTDHHKEHEVLVGQLDGLWPDPHSPAPANLVQAVEAWALGDLVSHMRDTDGRAVNMGRQSRVKMETGDAGRVERFVMTFDQS